MAQKLKSAAVTVVALHTLANVAHGVPHAEIPIVLAAWQSAFLFGVVLVAPLVALGLLWRGRENAGAALLAVSMTMSFGFGLYFHFGVPNPDHVAAVPAGPWHDAFRVTAFLVAVTDAVGVAVGSWIVVSLRSQSSSPTPALDAGR